MPPRCQNIATSKLLVWFPNFDPAKAKSIKVLTFEFQGIKAQAVFLKPKVSRSANVMPGVSWTPAKLRGARTKSDHGHRALQKYKGMLLSHCMAARLTLSPMASSIKVMCCPPCLFLTSTSFPYCSSASPHPSLVSSPSFLFSFALFCVPLTFPARSCIFF